MPDSLLVISTLCGDYPISINTSANSDSSLFQPDLELCYALPFSSSLHRLCLLSPTPETHKNTNANNTMQQPKPLKKPRSCQTSLSRPSLSQHSLLLMLSNRSAPCKRPCYTSWETWTSEPQSEQCVRPGHSEPDKSHRTVGR